MPDCTIDVPVFDAGGGLVWVCVGYEVTNKPWQFN